MNQNLNTLNGYHLVLEGVPEMVEKGNDDYLKKELGGEFYEEPVTGEVTGLAGNITDINLLEIVQFFSLTQKTKALEIYFEGKVGQFFIENGQIIHAVAGDASGEDAVYLCLSASENTFREIPWSDPETRSVSSPTSALLLDVVSRLDEEKQSGESESDGSGQPEGAGESAWRENCVSEIGRVSGIEGALLVTRMKDENGKVATVVNSTGSHLDKLRAIVQFFSGLSVKLTTATGYEKLRNILIRSNSGYQIAVISFKYGILCAAVNQTSSFDDVLSNLGKVFDRYGEN